MSKSDSRAQVGKSLASQVQRLRGWVGSDPSRAPELADALVALTEHRLLTHDFAGAAADAQASVKLAAQLLTAEGPIGPYTSANDGARYLDAVVQLAVLQAAVGLVADAAATVASADSLRTELAALPLATAVRSTTSVWALSCQSRAALAATDPAAANAFADAAWQRLHGGGLADLSDSGYLVLDTERLVSDARWAAGAASAAVAHLLAARSAYDTLVAGPLSTPARLDEAALERLAGPLFGLYRDLADRLFGIEEVDYGLVVRRELLERLRNLTSYRTEAPAQVAATLADLERDLRAHGRRAEASLVAEELAELAAPVREAAATLAAGNVIGEQVQWSALTADAAWTPGRQSDQEASREERFRHEMGSTLAALSRDARAAEAVREIEASAEAADHAAAQEAAAKAAAAQAAAEQASVAHQERLRVAAEAAAEAEREATAAADRAEVKRRRAIRIEEHRHIEEQRIEQERLDRERLERERLEQEGGEPGSPELEQAEPAPIDAGETAQAQLRLASEEAAAEAAEAERQAAAAAERAASKRRQAVRLESHPIEVEGVESRLDQASPTPAPGPGPAETQSEPDRPDTTGPEPTGPETTPEPTGPEPTGAVQPEDSEQPMAETRSNALDAESQTPESTMSEADAPVETPRWRRLRRLLGGK